MAHKKYTALEIMQQCAGPIDGFCSGIGTGGTITGIGEVLKAQYPSIEIWAVEPENAAILAGGTIGTHLQMGIGDGIIPDILNREIYDEIYVVTDEEALSTAKRLAREEGLMCGISSGTSANKRRWAFWRGFGQRHIMIKYHQRRVRSFMVRLRGCCFNASIRLEIIM